jgi:hypothetical protein
MNWFERYYISGAYFVSLVLIWLNVLTPNNPIWCSGNQLAGVMAFSAFIALPAGYILTTFTHYLYGSQIIRWPPPIFNKILKNLGLSETPLGKADEFIIEAELSVPGRYTGITERSIKSDEDKEQNIDRIKYLSKMMTKRWAALAISNNFILATPLAILLSVVIVIISNFYCPIDFVSWLNLSVIVLLIICVLACVIIGLNNQRLAEQIIIMHTKLIEKTPAFQNELKEIVREYTGKSMNKSAE